MTFHPTPSVQNSCNSFKLYPKMCCCKRKVNYLQNNSSLMYPQLIHSSLSCDLLLISKKSNCLVRQHMMIFKSSYMLSASWRHIYNTKTNNISRLFTYRLICFVILELGIRWAAKHWRFGFLVAVIFNT